MYCLEPIILKNPIYDNEKSSRKFYYRSRVYDAFNRRHTTPLRTILVPCGQCVGCRKHKTAQTVGMLIAECKTNSGHAFFVTLTKDDDHSDNNVKRDDLAPLIDAINKSNKRKGTNYKYYLTSEYGSDTLRPHYHGIFFGFENMKVLGKFIEKYYGLGHITLSDCNPARLNYVANAHVNKCSHVPEIEYVDENTGEVFVLPADPCFIRRSRGIGRDYCYQHAFAIDRDNCLKFNGMSYPIPDCFRKYIADALGYSLEFHKFLLSQHLTSDLDRWRSVALKYGFKLNDFKDVERFHKYYKRVLKNQLERTYVKTYICKDNSHSNLTKKV